MHLSLKYILYRILKESLQDIFPDQVFNQFFNFVLVDSLATSVRSYVLDVRKYYNVLNWYLKCYGSKYLPSS